MIYRTASAAEVRELRVIWNEVTQGCDAHEAGDVFGDILARYGEGHRFYHNTGHLVELFEYWRAYKSEMAAPRELALAFFFHDAVYDIPAKDNEERSAAYAAAQMGRLGFAPEIITRVADLVRMTATHTAPPGDRDAALMLDMDTAVLGAPPDMYDRYAAAIRAEYAPAYTPEVYAAGRRGLFLEPWLQRPRLFRTDIFEARYGTQAKANMGRELARL